MRLRLLVLIAALCSVGLLPADEARLSLGAGVTEIVKIQQEGVASIEVVLPAEWRALHPLAGLHVSAEGDSYLYAGGLYEWRFGERWRGSFGLAAGAFHYEGGYQLGCLLEFQSRIMLERVWDRGMRTGFTYQHISHAGAGGNNPGSERLLLTVSFPLR